jgi:hypothetical protein
MESNLHLYSEEVYRRHRIWAKERLDPKPSLDAVMSHAQLEKKVADCLRDCRESRHPLLLQKLVRPLLQQ